MKSFKQFVTEAEVTRHNVEPRHQIYINLINKMTAMDENGNPVYTADQRDRMYRQAVELEAEMKKGYAERSGRDAAIVARATTLAANRKRLEDDQK
jgi:hypothetical protein